MNSQKASLILEKAMQEMGIDPNMKTDPKVIQTIIKEMKLDDFKTKYKPIREFFENITNSQQSLRPMIDNIRQGIISKNPAVLEFIEKALNQNWFSKSEHIQKSIHRAFILEALTVAMINSNEFSIEIQDHFLNKRKEYGINTSSSLNTFWKIWRLFGSVFMGAKIISVDPAITYYRFKCNPSKFSLTKKYFKKLYGKGNLTYPEYKIMLSSLKEKKKLNHNGLCMNIYEAGITEYKKGFESNALCAHVLSEEVTRNPHLQVFRKSNIFPEYAKNNFYKTLKNKNNISSTINFHKDWVNLYSTWNMAFILSELNDLHILFPKLLIPSVIDARNESYMTTRVIALWLSINTILFRKLDGKKEVKGPKNKKKMAKVWGDLNKKYALKLSKEHTKIKAKDLDKGLKKICSHPIYNLVKLWVRD